MALLEVDGLASVTPLSLSTAPPGDLRERDVVVVGYPALDPRNAVDVQNRIFAGVFNVKRLQPGKLRDVESIRSFGHAVEAVTHDSSTLGGNSGSAVVDVQDRRGGGPALRGRLPRGELCGARRMSSRWTGASWTRE